LEEKKAEAESADYSREAQVKDLFGCNRDHSKEIDIYNRSYEDKIDRVKQLKEEGNASFKL